MIQKRSDMLSVSLACASSIEVGDVVIINSSKAVVKCNSAGSVKVVGTVAVHRADALTCTIETRFRERRDDRVSGAAVSVGAFVFDAAGKVINYSSATHDPAAIAGLVITTANGGNVAVETLEY